MIQRDPEEEALRQASAEASKMLRPDTPDMEQLELVEADLEFAVSVLRGHLDDKVDEDRRARLQSAIMTLETFIETGRRP